MKIPQDMMAGAVHKTNCSGLLMIDGYSGAKKVFVSFIETGFKTVASAQHIRSGSVYDYLKPSVCEVGFVGVGNHNPSSKGTHTRHYSVWKSMINRCYSKKSKIKHPTYADCTVHPDWHNFQNFAKWYDDNYPNDGKKYHLDKDLTSAGNKIYSENNCKLIPQWLNNFTVSRESCRGEFPVGVSFSKLREKFEAYCSEGGEKINLGFYYTPEAAHLAWRKYKLALALYKKPAMDAIDLRIYPNVIQIITEAR